MAHLKVLKKTSRVIEVLGGSAATQRKLRASATAVSNWKVLNRMPWRLFYPVREALKPFGYTVGQPLFGLTDDVIRKRKKKPPRKKTGGGRGSVKGGTNGKRNTLRKRPAIVVGPNVRNTAGTMADLDGGRNQQTDGAVAQRHHRQGVAAQAASEEA